MASDLPQFPALANVERVAPEQAAAAIGQGFAGIVELPGSTFRDNSTVILIPTRGTIAWQVVQAWQNLLAPMNSKRFCVFCVGDEVGHAYNRMVQHVLDHPELGKWKYILTLEDDNLPTPDAHIRLLEAIELGFDAVSGIYFTKGGEHQMPMAYGDPEKFRDSGVLTFEPIDIRACLATSRVLEVNGIAMGLALWKMDLFREIGAPWFVSAIEEIQEENGRIGAMTQDLYFCRKAKLAGKRFAVDTRAKAGHLDLNTGIVY